MRYEYDGIENLICSKSKKKILWFREPKSNPKDGERERDRQVDRKFDNLISFRNLQNNWSLKFAQAKKKMIRNDKSGRTNCLEKEQKKHKNQLYPSSY